MLYTTDKVAHAQYIAASTEGKKIGALDFLFDYLIAQNQKAYFDFGISTEHSGMYLNQGLVQFKEGFGGVGLTHEFYKIKLK